MKDKRQKKVQEIKIFLKKKTQKKLCEYMKKYYLVHEK